VSPVNAQSFPLTKVFRAGASRQRLAKGYIVEAPASSDLGAMLLAPGSRLAGRAAEHGLTLRSVGNAVWIDTGLIWLHCYADREKLARGLEALLPELVTACASLGLRLLPSAVRLDDTTPWSQRVCGDQHFLETSDEREKAVFCNLVRFHLPELLALTGRAGATPSGVERLGSRRLADSRRHVPACAFASLAPAYLPHLMKSLARDERVHDTSLLDVDPHVGDGSQASDEACVELRFVDAQLNFRTTLSHALLFEALLIRARRIVTEDQSIPSYSQERFKRDRARAIQHGLQARFAPHSPAEIDDYPWSTPPANTDPAAAVSAPARLLRLLDDLQFEFLALDAHYRDLAPMVLGLKLSQWGNLSLQNENELLQSTLAGAPRGNPEPLIQRLMLDKYDPLTTANERFEHARDVKAEWNARLGHRGAP
jgi:hypothetical protein